MTCVSERSGSASSRIWCRMWKAKTQSAATPSRTRARFRAENSMILPDHRAPPPAVPGGRRPVDGGAEAGLRVEQEVGPVHDRLARLQPERICACPSPRSPTVTWRGS